MKKPPYRGFVNTGSYTYTDPTGVVGYSSGFVSDETGSFSSVKTPGFKTIPKHLRPMNPFSQTQTNTEYFSGVYGTESWRFDWEQMIWRWMPYIYQGQIYGVISAYSSFPLRSGDQSDSVNKAKNAVLSKIKGSSASLGQAFVERKQTVNMITKNINRIASAALAIRRGNLKHASYLFGMNRVSGKDLQRTIPPSPKNLANHWLEYSYGWRPLLQDIHDSCELIADTYHRRKPTVVTATGLHEFTDEYLVGEGTFHKEICKTKSNSRTRYVIFFEESDAFIRSAEKTGILNPLSLAWEVIPYSFVIDWFLPVGNYLENLNATAGLSFKSGTSSTRVLTTHVTYLMSKPQDSDRTYASGGKKILSESKSRSVLSSFPSPVLEANFSGLGTNRAISALALLTQAFRR